MSEDAQCEAFAWVGLHGGQYLIRERSRQYSGTVRYSVWAEGDEEPMVSYATTAKRFAEWERKAPPHPEHDAGEAQRGQIEGEW